MAVPRAQLGGIYGSGQYPVAPHIVDVAGAIQALTGGAASLLHGQYVRKVAQQNYLLNVARLQQETELRKAQLEALGAYRAAQLGNQQGRIAAPGKRALQQQRDAFSTLLKEDPQNELVKPNDDGTPAEFDENTDYKTPLAAVLRAKGDAAKEVARHQDQLDTLKKAAQLRDWLQTQKVKEQAGGAGKPLSPAQVRMQKNDFLNRVATLSGGDPDKAAAMLASDKDVAAAASKFGVQDYEVRAAATALGTKNAPTSSTSTQSMPDTKGNMSPVQTTTTTRGKLPAPLATPTPAATLRPAGAPLDPNATAPLAPYPPVAPGPVPVLPSRLATPAPAGSPASPPAPSSTPQMSITPLVRPAGPTAATPAPGTLNMKPLDPEAGMSDADLWEAKRKQGLSVDDATAYVKARTKPVAASVPAPNVVAPVAPKPPDEDETLPPEE